MYITSIHYDENCGKQTSGTLSKHARCLEEFHWRKSLLCWVGLLWYKRIKSELVDKLVKIVRTHQLTHHESLREGQGDREDAVGKDLPSYWSARVWGPLQASNFLYIFCIDTCALICCFLVLWIKPLFTVIAECFWSFLRPRLTFLIGQTWARAQVQWRRMGRRWWRVLERLSIISMIFLVQWATSVGCTPLS